MLFFFFFNASLYSESNILPINLNSYKILLAESNDFTTLCQINGWVSTSVTSCLKNDHDIKQILFMLSCLVIENSKIEQWGWGKVSARFLNSITTTSLWSKPMVMPTERDSGVLPGHTLTLFFLLWLVAMGREFGLMALKSALSLLQLVAWFDEKGGTVGHAPKHSASFVISCLKFLLLTHT